MALACLVNRSRWWNNHTWDRTASMESSHNLCNWGGANMRWMLFWDTCHTNISTSTILISGYSSSKEHISPWLFHTHVWMTIMSQPLSLLTYLRESCTIWVERMVESYLFMGNWLKVIGIISPIASTTDVWRWIQKMKVSQLWSHCPNTICGKESSLWRFTHCPTS